MAKKQHKRPSPLPDPSSSSSSSSSSDSEEPPSSQEEEEQVQVSSEEEEEEEQQPQLESDSDQPPIAHRSAAKRAAENNVDPERAKKNKKAVVVDGSDAKKQFLRVWSVEDETAILKGLAEFISKTGNDPLKHGDAFYDFMKNSLQLDSNTKHLMQKVRRLKYKFQTYVAKGYNGDGPNFPKAHFDLCKKIWSSTEPKSKSKSKSTEAAAEENPNSTSNAMNVPSSSAKNSKSDKQVGVDTDVEGSLLLRSVMFGYGNLGVNLNEDVVKKGLELIGASKRAELEARWRKLEVAELELVAKRAQLIHDQSRIILGAYKSSNN